MSMWSAVFSFTQSAPCAPCQFTKSLHMHTSLSATFPWLVHHYVPTIHPFHQHFVNFPTPRCCHACSKSGHIATFGHSCPPHHPHPGVTPLQHWPQRPFFWEAGTLIGGPPPLPSYPWQCFAHMHTCTSISSPIALHLHPPVHPSHSTTPTSFAHHHPPSPSFHF